MTKVDLVDILNRVLKQKRGSDNYQDGAFDMYNAILKHLEAK